MYGQGHTYKDKDVHTNGMNSVNTTVPEVVAFYATLVIKCVVYAAVVKN